MLTPGDDPTSLLAQVWRIAGRPLGEFVADLGGSYSTNLKVGGASELVVRIHQDFVTEQRLAAEQVARRVLARDDIPVALPLDIFEGRSIARLADGRVVEVEPFIAADDRMDTPDRLISGAGLLARVHDCWLRAGLPPAAQRVRYANHLPTELAEPRVRLGAERIRGWDDPGLNEFADRVVEHITEVVRREAPLVSQLATQPGHGDWWDNNVLFRDGRPAVVLDLGFMASRRRIDDLALPMWFHLLRDGAALPGAADAALFAAMVDAYDAQAERPLSPVERQALPLAIARQPAWSIGRWVLELPDDAARRHAVDTRGEFAAASHLLAHAEQFMAALA